MAAGIDFTAEGLAAPGKHRERWGESANIRKCCNVGGLTPSITWSLDLADWQQIGIELLMLAIFENSLAVMTGIQVSNLSQPSYPLLF